MKVTIDHSPDGEFVVVLKDVPPYVIPLRIAPERIEPFLLSGRWLVVAFTVWGVDDRDVAHMAVSLTEKYSGRFSLGLRPVEHPSENARWIAGLSADILQENCEAELEVEDGCSHLTIRSASGKSPIVLVLMDGAVKSMSLGRVTLDEMERMIQSILPAPSL